MDKPRTRRKWLRIAGWTFFGLLGVLAVGLLLVRFWIAPWLIRSQVASAISQRWQGTVEVDSVTFRFTGPIEIGSLRLLGPDGRTWLRVRGVDLKLDDWPGLSPVLTAVDVERVEVSGHFPDRQLQLPLRPAEPSEPGAAGAGEYVDLQRVTIDRLEVDARYAQSRHSRLEPMSVELRSSGPGYEFDVIGLEQNRTILTGRFNSQGDLVGHLQWTRGIDPAESTFLLAALAGVEASATGQIELDLSVSMQQGQAESLEIRGQARLARAQASVRDRQLFEQLQARIEFRGDTLELTEFSARSPGGKVTGSGEMDLPLGQPLRWQMSLQAEKVPLGPLAELAEQLPALEGHGRLDLQAGGDLERIELAGQAGIDSAIQLAPLQMATGSMEFDLVLQPDASGPLRMFPRGRARLFDWTFTGAGGPPGRLENLDLQMRGRQVEISGARGGFASAVIEAAGVVDLPLEDQPLQYSLDIESRRPLQLEQLGQWLAMQLPAATTSWDLRLEGSQTQQLRLAGRVSGEFQDAGEPVESIGAQASLDLELRDFADPSRARISGLAVIDDGQIHGPGGRIAEKISGRLSLDGRSGRLEQLRLMAGGGELTSAGQAAWPIGGELEYRGDVETRAIDLGRLAQLAGMDVPIQPGSAPLSGGAAFEGGLDQLALAGKLDVRMTLRQAGGMRISGQWTGRANGPLHTGAEGKWTGRAELDEWMLRRLDRPTVEQPLLDDLSARLTVGTDRAELADLRASMPWGPLRAQAALQRLEEGELEASASVQGLQLGALGRYFLPSMPELGAPTDLELAATVQPGRQIKLSVDGSSEADGFGATGQGDMQMQLTIDSYDQPDERSLSGSARLDGWRVQSKGGLIFKNLAAQANLSGKTIKISSVSAGTAEGELAGSGSVTFAADQPVDWQGQLSFDGLDLPAVLALADKPLPVKAGRVALDLEASGQGSESLETQMSGQSDMQFFHELFVSAGGKWTAELELTGPLTDPGRLRVQGTARASDWQIRGPGGNWVEDLGISLLLRGRSGDISSLRGTVGPGRLIGRARLDLPAGGDLRYGGELQLKDIEIMDLARDMGYDVKQDLGHLQARYKFSGAGLDVARLAGVGAVSIGDSEIEQQAAFRALLNNLQIRPGEEGICDIDARFENSGMLMTVQEGKIATPMLAVVVEPGGTIDLETRQVDVYVIAGLLNEIGGLIGEVPVLRLTGALTSKLARLRVTGPFDDRSEIRVSKQPLRDLSSGTVDFLSRAVDRGGDVGSGVFRALERMFP